MHISNAISISGRTSGGYVSKLVSAYVKRVTDDGGVVEAKECVKAAFIELGAAPVASFPFNVTQWQLVTTQWQLITETYN